MKHNQKLLLILTISILLNLYSIAFAFASISVTATVDKTEASLEDQIFLTLSVEGARNVADPDLSVIKNFTIYSQGRSSKVQIINGSMSASVDFNYALSPEKAGDLIIPPISFEIEEKVYKSTQINIKISKDEPTQTPHHSTQHPDKNKKDKKENNSSEDLENDKDIFITTSVSDQTPFVNQQIIYTFRFYRRIQVRNAQLEPLNFEGFRSEQLGKKNENNEYTKVINGQQYSINEIKVALFPLSAGEYELKPTKLKCEVLYKTQRRARSPFDDFFNDSFLGGYDARPKTLRADPIKITVSPLPRGQIPGGISNLIGKYNITATVNKNELKVGESVTLTIKIDGTGNIEAIQEPKVGGLEDFKIYDDKPTTTINKGMNGLSGNKIFKKALIPLKDGKIQIPPLKLYYLDPELGQYRLSATQPIILDVSPTTEEERLNLVEAIGTQTNKEAIKELGKDILPIDKDLKTIVSSKVSFFNPFILIGIFLPPFLFIFTFIFDKRKNRLQQDQAYSKRKKAMFNLEKGLRKLKSLIADKDYRKFFAQASSLFKEYLGDKLDAVGKALTPQEIEEKLKINNLEE
ncbi:MAG: BatD family protein, partial [bacterium]